MKKGALIFLFLWMIIFGILASAQDTEKCYTKLDIQETKTADVYDDAGNVISQEIEFAVLNQNKIDGLYDSFINVYDLEVPGDYIIRTYEQDLSGNYVLLGTYSAYSGRFLLYDNFNDSENPGGVIEFNESDFEVILPYDLNVNRIRIEHNGVENELNYYTWTAPCVTSCKKENEEGYFSEDECCLGLIPAPQANSPYFFWCVNCGDGICSENEDIHTCYKDCSPCGNSVVDLYEECDDGNKNDNDGCDSFCKIETECRQDVNSDGRINILDLIEVRGQMNQPITDANIKLDVNLDGRINILDLIEVRSNMGRTCGVMMSPVSSQWWKILIVLGILGLIIFLAWKNKNKKRKKRK